MKDLDLKFDYYHGPGQGVHNTPRGCRVTARNGISCSCHAHRTRMENRRAAVRELEGKLAIEMWTGGDHGQSS